MATIRKRNDKWQVQIRRIGSRHFSRSFHLRKDAETWARQTEVQADRRDLPDDPKVLDRHTLGQLVERYRDTVSSKKRRHLVESIVLNAFLRHPICLKRLSDVTPQDFASYRDDRQRTIKASSLRRELGPLRHMFEIAREEWGLPIRENPLARVRLDKTDKRRERRLLQGEFDKIIEAASRSRNPYVASIVRFAVETGMRRGEILAMTWAHLDRQNSCVFIPHTKNGHSRTIPLTQAAWRAIDDLPRTDFVFPITANALRLAWERLIKNAGIEGDLHFHDLRHEAISRFFELGLSVPEVALISGHRDARMLFRYTHPLKEIILTKLEA